MQEKYIYFHGPILFRKKSVYFFQILVFALLMIPSIPLIKSDKITIDFSISKPNHSSNSFLPTLPQIHLGNYQNYLPVINKDADESFSKPTPKPTSKPTHKPSSTPTSVLTSTPTSVPTSTRTSAPTSTRTSVPTSTRTSVPTSTPNPAITIYYVSPSGNDSNPGTLGQPWRTIVKAARMVKAGDTVYIREGIYQESVDFATSGTSNAPIKILAYPGESPIMDGNNFTIPGYDFGPLLTLSGDYIQISGLEVRYSRGMGVVLSGSNDIASKVYSHHNRENGILISHGHNSIVENSIVWRNALSNEFGQGGNHASGLSAARNGVSYVTMRHNTVWENWGEGLSSYEADQIVIEDNFIHDNWSNVYISDSTNVLFQRNFVYTNPASYMYPYGSHDGISMGDETYNPPSANITVINNISFGNHVNFWWWQGFQGGGMNNVLIANNTFVNAIGNANEGNGNVTISIGDHQNVRFENNLVQQGGNFPVIATSAMPGVTYSHNLWSKQPWVAAAGPGDIIGDPLFTQTRDPYSPEWYKLTVLSPAINKALSLSEVNLDYFGMNRVAPPDIGASEFFPTP
jgi:hypothetical protein